MKRKPVRSSNIKSIGYDSATKTLEVEFHSGSVHQYAGVDQYKVDELMKAKSIGSHFHERIRKAHKSTKIS